MFRIPSSSTPFIPSSSSWISPVIKLAALAVGGGLTWLFLQKVKESYQKQQKTLETLDPEWLIREDLGNQVGITVDQITQTLDETGIRYSIVPANKWPPKNRIALPRDPDRPIDLFSALQEIVWRNDHAQIAIAKEQERFHLLVKPAKEISFVEISQKDYAYLKRIIALIPIVFEKVFGSPDFCEALVESKTTFGFEIFPGSRKESGEIDLYKKDQRNLYILSKGRWTPYSLPLDKIDALRREIPTIFFTPLDRREFPFPTHRTEANLEESRKFRILTLLKMLSSEGFPVMPVRPVKIYSVNKTGNTTRPFEKTNRCFLCPVNGEEVIYRLDKTLLVATGHPFVQNANDSRHALIAPVRHITDCSHLTSQEIQEERDLLLRLRKAWNAIYPDRGEEFFLWRQQGINAGQTVPHLHLQALTTTPKQLHEYYILATKDFLGRVPFVFSKNIDLAQKMHESSVA